MNDGSDLVYILKKQEVTNDNFYIYHQPFYK